MNRHLRYWIGSFATVFALGIIPAKAITNGEVDTSHLNVAAIGEAFAGEKFLVCTGTLIAPGLVLVAAHCIKWYSDPSMVVVTFDGNWQTASKFITASELFIDPGFFEGDGSDSHDLGVIVLSEEVVEWGGVAVTPAALPPAGLLDQLAAGGGLRGVAFVNVGYGISVEFQHGKPAGDSDEVRKVSTSPFKALTQTLLKQLTNYTATGEGGVCYFDSGGPKFLPGTNTIVAVQRGGDRMCRADSYAYRLDIPQARAFLGQFVELP